VLGVIAKLFSLSLEDIRNAQAIDDSLQPSHPSPVDGVKPPQDRLHDYPEEACILFFQWDSLVLEGSVLYRRYHYPDGTTSYPNPRLSLDPSSLPHIEQVKVAKLLGVVLSERLHFDDHVSAVLKACSQRMYLLKLLRAQGLPLTQMNTVFQALILNKIRYAIPAWSGFLSVHLLSQVNGLLKHCYKYGYCLKINIVEDIIESANYKLFRSLQSQQHYNTTSTLLPPIKPHNHDLIPKGHNYQIPN